MSLTPENLESRAEVFSHSAIIRDLARMNEPQLSGFVRKVFAGNRDTEDLPEPYWRYYFSLDKHGSSETGRDSPGVANFLAETHNLVGSILRGTFSIQGDELPALEYRPYFRRTLDGLLGELLEVDTPTEGQVRLAAFTAEAVGALQDPDGFIASGEQIKREIEAHGTPVPLHYSDELKQDIEALREEKPKMVAKVVALTNGGKFGELELDYI